MCVCVCVCVCVCARTRAPSCWVMSKSSQSHGLKPTGLLCPWGFSRQAYWNGFPCPPPGGLRNPGIEPRSPQYRHILYHLNHQESPRILEWLTYPFSRGSSNPGIKLGSPALQEDSLPAEPPSNLHIKSSTWQSLINFSPIIVNGLCFSSVFYNIFSTWSSRTLI